jgi:hypothetical protein
MNFEGTERPNVSVIEDSPLNLELESHTITQENKNKPLISNFDSAFETTPFDWKAPIFDFGVPLNLETISFSSLSKNEIQEKV